MFYQPHFLYRPKLIFCYILVQLKFLHPLLPKSLRQELPTGWNNKMFWVAFKSGGQRVYFEYECKLREPVSSQPKVVVDGEYQLTENDIRSFHENGYIGPFTVISPEEMESVREHLVNLVTNTDSKTLSFTINDKTDVATLNTRDRHLEDSVLMNLFKHPSITERCAQLLGPDLLLWRSAFFHIPAFSNGSPYHQSTTWFSNLRESILQPPNVEELFQLSCWIALQDTPKEKSCLKVVSNSRQEINPVKHSKSNGKDIIYNQYQLELDCQIDQKNVNLLEAKAGECIIFCERAIHGSTDNVTEDERWAVVGRIIRPDTRAYTEKMRDEGYKLEIYDADINLDNWRGVLLRGEDRYGLNRVLRETGVAINNS